MNAPTPVVPKPKKTNACLIALLITLGVGFALAILLVVLLFVFGSRETKSLTAAANPFLEKIRTSELQAAYEMASPKLRESVDFAEFEKFVNETNLAGYTNVDWRYASAENLDESALEGTVTTANSAKLSILVTMAKGENGHAVTAISKKTPQPAAEKKRSTTTTETWAKAESKGKSFSWSWSTARLENVRFATPSKPGTDPPVFPADCAKIFVEADLKSAPSDTTVSALFMLAKSADGEVSNLEVARTSVTGNSGNTVTFSFTRNDPVLAVGTWVVKLFIDNKLKAEKAFAVELDLDDITQKAAAGDADAQLAAGMAYRDGIIGYTGPTDDAEAVKWLKMAAELGERRAQFFLGEMFKFGDGVAQDPEAAFSWFKKSAGQGMVNAQRVLGVLYRNGDGVDQDLDQAATWFEKAATQGDVTATTHLGQLFLNYGDEARKAKGAELIQKAESAGDPDAQFILGQMHERGVVVEANRETAIKYYEKAATNGSAEAAEALKRLKGNPGE